MNSRRDFLALVGAFVARAGRAQKTSENFGGKTSENSRKFLGKTSENFPPKTSESLFEGAPAPDDALELLYSRRLSFDHGQPLITVRVVEGR